MFIARISRGRTIREFILGVMVGPTLFSVLWFGISGSVGFYAAINEQLPILDLARHNPSSITFYMLENMPMAWLTIPVVIAAAFLFVVTSVVSAAFVLGMFARKGDRNSPVQKPRIPIRHEQSCRYRDEH